MIDTTEQTTCLACGAPLIQIAGRGHRKKLYCNDICRQRGHRRQAQSKVTPVVTNDDLQQRIAELEAEVARYREIVDLSDRDKMVSQLLITGQEIGWRALLSIELKASEYSYRQFAQHADDKQLAIALAGARNMYKQLADLQTTTEVAVLNNLVAQLRQKLRECEKRNQL